MDLGQNQLRELPDEMANLMNLLYFWLEGNHIKEISERIHKISRYKYIHVNKAHYSSTLLTQIYLFEIWGF